MRKPKPRSANPSASIPLAERSDAALPAVTSEGGAATPPRFAAEALDYSGPHQVEQEVQRALLSQPSLRFASLVVRRIDNGVCLQGVLEVDEELPDVCHIARRVSGVRQVLNRLVIAPRREVPVKG